ncbi:hypothetical protein SBV1_3280021 [Verrucomicrobia bacterium]|nr:hypothetical protein SBV1_3280021 [Verrucomicrobiota bacterium]
MRCDEVQSLRGPYLDSELEATASLRIEQHLKSCPDCARLFDEEQRLEAWLKTGMNQGQRTASLWERTEQAVLEAERASFRRQPASRVVQPGLVARAVLALPERLWAGWRDSRRVWSALAATWIIILGLNLTARESRETQLARQDAPSASELRSALEQKQLLMVDLAVSIEPASVDKPKMVAPAPRSEQRQNARRTQAHV